jgi:ABC-type transporter Mla MlaB component
MIQGDPGAGIVLRGCIERCDLDLVCERAGELMSASDGSVVVCEVGGLERSDIVAVDAIARVQVIARRLGRELRLKNATIELRDLIGLAGLDDVVALEGN